MSLLNFLKQSENVRKVFGKRELKIIEKQLNGANLTQSEKNRLSRDIRPKFEFIKKCANFEEEFKLKKGAQVKSIIQEAKEIILNDKISKEIKNIFLFGSVIENKLTLRSDIDIAVEFKNINIKEATNFRIRASGRTSNKIDIQVFNVLPNKIKKSIINKHKILYQND